MSVQSPPVPLARNISFYRPELRAAHFAPRYWGTWAGLLLLSALAPLPLVVTRGVGAFLGAIMFFVNGKRRRIARTNLQLCFPELSAAARARLVRRHFIVYGQSVSDVAHLAWSSRRRLQRMTHWQGLDSYRQFVHGGRHVILLVPHLVGINFSGALLSRERSTFALVKPLRNDVMNWFLHRARTRFGAVLLTRRQGLRPVIRALRRGLTFYYLPDEDLGPKHSVFAPFFGVATATLSTLGRIAALSDAVVIPCFVRLAPWGRGYEIRMLPPLEDFPTGNENDDASRMNRAIEAGVRTMPEQYFWTFKLFKTRPTGEPSPYR
jgi:Kdo2-lipid IVA lauroyltransferase/acyltransferase